MCHVGSISKSRATYFSVLDLSAVVAVITLVQAVAGFIGHTMYSILSIGEFTCAFFIASRTFLGKMESSGCESNPA